MMKKVLLAAAALTLIGTAIPTLTASAQTAPATNTYCGMSYANGNGYAVRESWADYYHCWSGSTNRALYAHVPTAPAQPAPAPAPTKSSYCNMSPASGNGYAARESWADYYHCWG